MLRHGLRFLYHAPFGRLGHLGLLEQCGKRRYPPWGPRCAPLQTRGGSGAVGGGHGIVLIVGRSVVGRWNEPAFPCRPTPRWCLCRLAGAKILRIAKVSRHQVVDALRNGRLHEGVGGAAARGAQRGAAHLGVIGQVVQAL